MTAGMATNSPIAVVTRASEIPPATAPRPVAFWRGNFLEGVQNADHGAEQSHEGSGGTDGRQTAQAALQLGVNDGFGTLQRALGGFDLLAGNVSGIAVGLELLQAGGDDLGQVALLVALGNFDGFIDLAFTQGAGQRREQRHATVCGRR